MNLKEVQKRISDETDKKFVTEKLTHFMECKVESGLKSINDELFEYEKKYIVPYSEKCGLLVLGVGMREAPVILSILSVQPSKVVLLHTKGSEGTAQRVMADCDIAGLGILIEKVLIDEVDASENYRILKKDIIEKYGRHKDGMMIDPTGGRKIVSVSLGTFAFFYRIPIIYLHAEKSMGITIPFSGRIKRVDNPYDYYGDIELNLLCDYFKGYSFDAAFRICMGLRETVKDISLYVKLEIIGDIIEIYKDWDRFFHSQYFVSNRDRPENLSERLHNINEKMERFNHLIIKDISRNIEFLNRLDCGYECKKNICDKYRLIDLFCNAKRRESEGKHDDAVARLYRCLEMCSTIALKEFGIENVANPDYDLFAERIGKSSEEFIAELQKELGYVPEKLALSAQMELLAIAGSKIGAIYKGMQKEGKGDSLMDKRNRSILAHGTNPVSKDECYLMMEKTQAIIIRLVGKDWFKKAVDCATFPQLNM